MERLLIQDPNNSANDISGGSHKIHVIIDAFSKAHEALRRRMASLEDKSIAERNGASILGSVFAGNYEAFGQQRARLQKLFEERWAFIILCSLFCLIN